MTVKGKSPDRVVEELKLRGFCTFDWECELDWDDSKTMLRRLDTVLEARDCFKGQVIRFVRVVFHHGRAVTDVENV